MTEVRGAYVTQPSVTQRITALERQNIELSEEVASLRQWQVTAQAQLEAQQDEIERLRKARQ